VYNINEIILSIKTIRAPKIAILKGIPISNEIKRNITEPINGIGKNPMRNTNIKKNSVCKEASIIIPCIFNICKLYIKKFLIEIV